ncbi:MAG: hypothetical protein AABZ47_03030 [Planctomycetota bacterium]
MAKRRDRFSAVIRGLEDDSSTEEGFAGSSLLAESGSKNTIARHTVNRMTPVKKEQEVFMVQCPFYISE